MNYGKNISQIREKMGLSQAEFARQLKVSQSNLNRWESGTITPSIETVIKIVTTLGISFEELLLADNVQNNLKPALSARLKNIQKLTNKDQEALLQFIDTFIKSKK